jgi:voltage-gated sodium channel
VWSDSDEGSFEGDERILGHHQAKPIFLTPEQKMRIWRQTEDAHGVLDKHDRADEALWTRFQRRVGVLQVRMYIAYKKQVVEEEPAPFPTARDLCKSVKFEAFIGILIILNGILIGIDAMYKPGEDKPAIFAVAENWFTLLFLLEFVARIMAFTWVWMFTPMNAFDTFLIWVTGVLTNWVLTPAGVNADMIQRLAALRVLRLGRLCRAVRMMPLFHELWMLVQGVMECMSLLFWATVIIFSILYMFSVAMVEVITKSETFADDELVQDVFGNLHESMYTLFQIMTFDSWASIVRPIVFKMPEIIPLFLLFVGIAGLVLFNLMTAIVVKNAFEAAEEDVEARLKLEQDQQARHKEQLEDMFAELDKDDSGMLSKQEFAESVLDDMVFIHQLKTLDIELEELPDVFEILDDGDGEVSTQEFCDGLMRMQGNAMSKDMLKATKKAKNVNEFFERVLMCVENLAAKRPDAYPEQQSTLDRVEIALDDAHYHFNEMQAMSAEVLKKLDSVGLRRAVKAVSSVLPTMQEPETSGLGETLTEQREREHEMKMKIKNAQQNPDKFMQPLPTEWIHSRKMEKQQAMLMRQLSGEEDDIEDVAAPCVAQEFQKQWEDLEMWRPEMTFGEVMQVPEHPEEDQDPVSKLKAQGKIRTLPSTLVEAKVWEPTEEPAEAVVEKPSPWRSTRHKPQQPEPSHPHSVPQELRISDL